MSEISLNMWDVEETKQTRNRLSGNQKKMLLQFMENHPLFAQNLGDSRVNDSLWLVLTEQLNRNGSTTRNVKGWQKSWADLQRSVDKRRDSLKPGKQLHADDLKVLALMGPQPSSIDMDQRCRSLSLSPMRSQDLSAPPSRKSRSPTVPAHSIVALEPSPRGRSRSPVWNSDSQPASVCHQPIYRSSLQSCGSRQPIRLSSSQSSGSREPIHRSSLQSSGPRQLVHRSGSQSSESRQPIHRSSLQSCGSLKPVHGSSSQSYGSREPVHHSSSQSCASRQPVYGSSSQSSGSYKPVHSSSLQSSGSHPPVHGANSQASGSRPVYNKGTKTELSSQIRKRSTVPLQIDLTKEKPSRDAVHVPRKFAPSVSTAVHSTGQNTAAVINAMEENSACWRESVAQLIRVIETQNNILKTGFQDVGRKIRSAVLKATGSSPDKPIAEGVDENEIPEVDEEQSVGDDFQQHYKDEVFEDQKMNENEGNSEAHEDEAYVAVKYLLENDIDDGGEMEYGDIPHSEEGYVEDMQDGESPS